MVWTLKTYSGLAIQLTEEEKNYYVAKVQAGVKVIIIGGKILSPSFEYIISDEQLRLEKLRENPILNDPDFAKMINGDYDAKSAATRRLDEKYPNGKYAQQWDEAMHNKDYLTSIEITT